MLDQEARDAVQFFLVDGSQPLEPPRDGARTRSPLAAVVDFGFLVRAGIGGVAAEVYGERTGPRLALVSWARKGADLAVIVGRLYYTDALGAWTGSPPAALVPEPDSQCDAELILVCYQREGISGLEQLEGDFAVVVWDGRRRRFVARRDPLGAYPLFWTQVGGTTAFATGLAPLAALLPTRYLDPGQLAEGLLASSNRERSEACVYAGINRVLADTIVTIDSDRESVRRRRYWDWRTRAVDPGSDQLLDLAPRYCELLTEAVRQRMIGTSGAELSGGMDSTSVCLLALGLVQAGQAASPLHAFSLIYKALPDLAKEQRYIDAAVVSAGTQLVHHRLHSDDLLDFEGFTNPPPHDEPIPWTDIASCRAELSLAAELGVRSLLTGMGADDLLDMRPYHLSDLLCAGHGLTAWRDACSWAEAHRGNAFRILRRYGFAGLWWNRWPGGLRGGRGQRRIGSDEKVQWRVPPWIRPEFARRHNLADRLVDQNRQAHRGETSMALSMGVYALQRRVGHDYRWRLAAPLNLSLTHPFLDPRVASFALGTLQRLRPDPDRFKPLLAEAMINVLPDTIRSRSDKRPFNEVFYLGLSRNLPSLLAVLNEPALTELGMIDADMVADALEDAALGVVAPWSSFSVAHVPGLAVWLAHRDQWHRPPVPTVRIEMEAGPVC